VRPLLHRAADLAGEYLDALPDRAVAPAAGADTLRDALASELPDEGVEPETVLDDLARWADPGLTAMGSPRFFGWVVGGALPAAIGADWLATAWDQNAVLSGRTPAVAVLEETAGRWTLDLLGLPPSASFAFVTGSQMAHVTALAAARWRLFARAGWDVERRGLAGSPPIRVYAGAERHVTVDRALRLLGLGSACVEPVEVDQSGAMRASALEALLADEEGPAIVCVEAGNVDTGAVDPMHALCDIAHERGAWVHVDGAFGLWAAASPTRRRLLEGVELADSWTMDAHKWLNVPYDCGIAVVADRDAHHAAMSISAPYLQHAHEGGVRDPIAWTPEFSRRARGVAVYAALRSLGRSGTAALVDGLCDCAERFAERLAGQPRVTVLAQGLNQVLVRFGDDAHTEQVLEAVARDGTCFMSATTWRGRHCMRISVSNWRTTFEDVDRSVEAVLRAAAG